MKILKNYDQFKQSEKLTEKWYHNILAGLTMLAPSVMSQTYTTSTEISKDTIVKLDKNETLKTVSEVIDYVKKNKSEYKNAKKVISELEKLITKYRNGHYSEKEMSKLASVFLEEAKSLDNPEIFLAKSDKIGGRNMETYDTLSIRKFEKNEIVNKKWENIDLNIDLSGSYVSGGYEIDKELLRRNIEDTLANFEGRLLDYQVIKVYTSTDGQGLSNRLKKDLQSQGYDPNNQGLSQKRNDVIKEAIVDILDYKDTIIQDPRYTDDGEIDPNKRYSFVTIQIKVDDKIETTESKSEDNLIIFYKITDGKNDKVKKVGKYNPIRQNNNYKPGENITTCYWQ
jgi:DNA-binding transcriptional regulator YhcF (GntR family)